MIMITSTSGLAGCWSVACCVSLFWHPSLSPAFDDPDYCASKLDHIVCRLGSLIRALPNTLGGSATGQADQIVLRISLIFGQSSQFQCAAMKHLQHLLQGCVDAHAFSPHMSRNVQALGLGQLGGRRDADRGDWLPSPIWRNDAASPLIYG
jgi:hypothetical protein